MKEEKIKVVIEDVEDEKVAVYNFDELTQNVIGSPFEVCHRLVAMEEYYVVGEINFGKVDLYNDYNEEEDYSYPEMEEEPEDDEI